MPITIQAISEPKPMGITPVKLRLYPWKTFITPTGFIVMRGSPYGLSLIMAGKEYAVTINGANVDIPAVTLDATEDSNDPGSRWGAFYFDAVARLLVPFSVFASFIVPPTPTTTTWDAIRAYNGG